MRVWDVETGECLKVMEGHTFEVNSVALSGDGKRVVSGSKDNTTVRVWDVEMMGRECLKGSTDGGANTRPIRSRQVPRSTQRRWQRRWRRRWPETSSTDRGVARQMGPHTDEGEIGGGERGREEGGEREHDKTVRVWDVETGECLKVMEGTRIRWSRWR